MVHAKVCPIVFGRRKKRGFAGEVVEITTPRLIVHRGRLCIELASRIGPFALPSNDLVHGWKCIQGINTFDTVHWPEAVPAITYVVSGKKPPCGIKYLAFLYGGKDRMQEIRAYISAQTLDIIEFERMLKRAIHCGIEYSAREVEDMRAQCSVVE